MTRMQKRVIALIALVVVLAAVIVAIVVIKNKPVETEPYVSSATSLVSEDSATISKLSFGRLGGDNYTFTRADYKWTYTADPSFPVNDTLLDNMASAVSSVTTLRTIGTETKDEYGLGEGALVIHAEFASNAVIRSYDLTVGALNSYNSSTYIKTDGEVYMFSDSLSEEFDKELNDLIKLDDPEATVDTNYLVALDLLDGEGHVNSITDTAGMRELLEQSDVYECLDWVEYAVSEERFAEYGITPDSGRLIIRYKAAQAVTDENGEDSTIRVEESYEIVFGDRVTEEDETGESAEYVYYTVTGSTIVYKAPIADYEATMAYLDYTPETDTASEPETDAAGTDAVTG